jgi:hypothetical protein
MHTVRGPRLAQRAHVVLAQWTDYYVKTVMYSHVTYVIKLNEIGSPLGAHAEQTNGQREPLVRNLAAQTLGWPFALARAVHAGSMVMERVAWVAWAVHLHQFLFQLSPEHTPWA